jgi:hypothetical protein
VYIRVNLIMKLGTLQIYDFFQKIVSIISNLSSTQSKLDF